MKAFAAALLFVAVTSPVWAKLKDENLLVNPPAGFKVGYTAGDARLGIMEFVPQNETVNDWSRMVTVQIFHQLHNSNADAFAANLGKGWALSCPGGESQKSKAGIENGYPFSIWVYECPLNPQTGKPETMFLKATSGTDSLYAVQYAYRADASKEMVLPAMRYLGAVRVCDTRRSDRACPTSMQ